MKIPAVFLALALFQAESVRNALPDPLPDSLSPEHWLKAVVAHEPGTRDEALQTVYDWDPAALEDVLIEVRRRMAGRKRPLDANDLLLRGAALHLDLAIVAHTRGARTFTPSSARGARRPAQSVLVKDGQYAGMEYAENHWFHGRALLDAIEPRQADIPAVRLWYRAASAYMGFTEHLSELTPHLEHARKVLPEDAGVMFDSGCLHETYAMPRIQGAVRSTKLPNQLSFGVPNERANLRQAERYLRRALALDPALVEARVRHGRVLSELGRDTEAVPRLEQAVAAASDTTMRYYALMFLGRAQQRLGLADPARQAYERAQHLFPTAQSPVIALSHLAYEQGDSPAALRTLKPLATLSADRPDDDPWWNYPVCHAGDSRVLLAEWLKAAPPPRPRVGLNR